MNVAMTQVGPPIRTLWINVARALQSDGHRVVFLGPSPAFEALLHREGLGDAVYMFDKPERVKIPDEERASDVVDYNERVLGRTREQLQQRAFNYHHWFDVLEVDVAVFWNDIDIGRLVADANDMVTVFLENGYLEDSLQVDPEGVNCNASFASFDYDEILEATPLWEPTYELTRPIDRIESLSLPSKARALCRTRGTLGNFRWTIRQELGSRIASTRRRMARGADQSVTPPDEHLLIVFQVHDDTQVLYNSPYVSDMGELVDLVTHALSNTEFDLPVVAKEHPADIGRMNYSDVRARYPDIVWLRNFDLDELLEKSRTVVTINSSVGMQALDRNVPVVTLGNSFYDGNPFVEHPTGPTDVAPALSRALSRTLDDAAVREYLNAFRERLFIDGGLGALRATTIDHICSAILNVGSQKSTSFSSS